VAVIRAPACRAASPIMARSAVLTRPASCPKLPRRRPGQTRSPPGNPARAHQAVLPVGPPSMPAPGENLADSRPGRAVFVSRRDRAWRSSDRRVSRISPSEP
jgi:hypothetical protein